MKDKIIRLLKAIGIALCLFGGIALLTMVFVKYTMCACAVVIVLLFIFVVWRIYKDGEY